MKEAGAVIWLQGSCTGIFTVNLNAGEIIVDDVNDYVLVRIPRPSLTTFETPDFEVMYYNSNTPFPNYWTEAQK